MADPTTYSERLRDPDQWRRWLEENHASAAEAWLILYKKKYVDQGLSLEEATVEAMCFGWVDSQLKGLDERCYTLRYTPRTPNSIWSMSNIRRVEQLIAEGRMTDAQTWGGRRSARQRPVGGGYPPRAGGCHPRGIGKRASAGRGRGCRLSALPLLAEEAAYLLATDRGT